MNKKYKICLDSGHGGKDSGAINRDIYEKDIALSITKKLYQRLLDSPYKPFLTRDDDYYMGINKRWKMANKQFVDIFISIHCNAVNNQAVQGTEVLYYPTSRNGKKLAKFVYDELIDKLQRAKRGIVPRDDLGVIEYTHMPAIIVETAFLSNPTECELLQDKRFQDKTVEAIFNGIEKYFEEGSE